MSIQVRHAFDRLNLCQNRRDTLFVPLDWDAFAVSNVFAIAHGYDDNLRFGATAARNAKHLFERPDFFSSFDEKTCH